MGCLQRQISTHSWTGGSYTLPGVDLPKPEETLAGQGSGGQEPEDEGFLGLHEVGHSSYAEPCQCPHTAYGAVLRATVRIKNIFF